MFDLVPALRRGLSVSCLFAFAGLYSPAEPLKPLVLDGDWMFHYAPDAAAAQAQEKFYEVSADVSGYRTLKVPSNWATEGIEEPVYDAYSPAEGFYRRTIDVPAAAAGQRIVLHFDGAWASSEIWVNGNPIGRRNSGFTAFAFDVTDHVKPGQNNLFAVRLRQENPFVRMDCNDDWSLPGIYRSVWLEFLPKPFNLERIEVVTDFDADYVNADLRIRALVARYERGHPWKSISEPVEVRAMLTDAHKNKVAETVATVQLTGGRTDRDVPLVMHLSKPTAWTAETPHLYDLRVDLVIKGEVVHSRTERVGFREITTTGGVLRLNGRPIKLRGVDRHDLDYQVGRATRYEHWLADLQAMKAANINTVRTSHYPPAEGFLKLCDELGFYVFDEVPTGLFDEFENPAAIAEGLARVDETVRRDRNHPSIIGWDLGNEDPLTQFHITCARALKGMDPTRPILMPWRAELDLPPEFDLLAPHYRSAEEYDRLAAESTRPILTTEYSHALGPDDFGGLKERWAAIVRHPTGAGGMIWLWADQGLRRKVNGQTVLHPNRDLPKYKQRGSDLVISRKLDGDYILDTRGYFGSDGIVDGDRKPQRDYWETRAVYSPVQVLTESIPLPAQPDEVFIRLQNAYDFTDLSAVKTKWELFRDGEKLAEGSAALACRPHTEANLQLALPKTDFAAGNHYVHLTFWDASGTELTKAAVRLVSHPFTSSATRTIGPAPKVSRARGVVTVSTGSTRYEINEATGQLAMAEFAGTKVLENAQLAIWREPTQSEHGALLRRKTQRPWSNFLSDLPAQSTAFHLVEHDGLTEITATVVYQAIGDNKVEVDYRYRFAGDGSLTLTYTLRPKIQDIDALPEIGLDFTVNSAFGTLSWLGLGPGDALPNRHASAIFGRWSLSWLTADDAARPRWGVESLQLQSSAAGAVQVEGVSGFHKSEPDGRLRLLTHQAGAWTKFEGPESPAWRLDLRPDRTFQGEIKFFPAPAIRPQNHPDNRD